MGGCVGVAAIGGTMGGCVCVAAIGGTMGGCVGVGGDTLNITAGIGGVGNYRAQGANGTSTSVVDVSTSGSKINVFAEGGSGGYYAAVNGKGGNQCLLSGSSHMHHGPAVFELMRHPRILDVVEDIIGKPNAMGAMVVTYTMVMRKTLMAPLMRWT